MKTITRSQIVITGPRSSASELVLALESEEFGRTAGAPPLPIDTVIAPRLGRVCLTKGVSGGWASRPQRPGNDQRR